MVFCGGGLLINVCKLPVLVGKLTTRAGQAAVLHGCGVYRDEHPHVPGQDPHRVRRGHRAAGVQGGPSQHRT